MFLASFRGSSRISPSGNPSFFGLQPFEFVLDQKFFTLESGDFKIIDRWPRHFGLYLYFQRTMFFAQFGDMCIKRHQHLPYGQIMDNGSVTNPEPFVQPAP